MGGYVGIPMSYTPVEYIESSGTQYIDTGVSPKPTTKLEFDANIVSGDANVWLGVWGSRTNTTSDFFCLYAQTSSPHYLTPNYAGFDPGTSGNTSINFNQRYLLTQDKGQFYIDGVKATALSTTNTLVAGTQPIYLFTNNNLGTPQMRGQDVKLYGCKIYDGDTLTRNFIPVVDQDNVACLYDLVEGKHYYNQGSGTFTAGSATGSAVTVGDRARKISKAYVGVQQSYTPVEYIESSGTQFIDTGITQNGYHSVLDVSFTDFTNLQIITGTYGPSDNQRYYTRINTNGSLVTQFGGYSGNNLITGPTLSANTRYAINTKLFNGVQSLIVDGTTYGTQAISGQTFPTANIYLFSIWANGSPANFVDCKMYEAKYYDVSGTLIRHFIPVIDQDNVACLYDLVEGKFYYNKGTGTFTAGSATGQPVSLGNFARKIRKGYVGITSTFTPVEYIQSFGTQYIDTGHTPTENTNILCQIKTASSMQTDSNVFTATWNASGFAMIINNQSPSKFMWHNGSAQTLSNVTADTEYIFDVYQNKVKINNTQVLDISYTTQTYSETIKLFGMPGQQHMGNYKLNYFKIYENNTLVRDFIPVLDENNVACLYEQVEGKLYYNQGTGTFTAGSATGQPVVVGSRARLCYYGVSTRKISSVPDLSVARFFMGFAWTGKYAVFAGGTTHASSSGTHKNTVDAYDSSNFTRSTATAIYTAANKLGSAHIGDYAIFAGGTNYNSGQNQVNAYSSTLVRTNPTALSFTAVQSGGATVSNTYALITGRNTSVNAYNASLTRTNLGSIVTNKERWNMMTPVGNYVVMPGGYVYPSGGTNTVEVINSSLVKSTATNLANSYGQGAVATSNSKFAIVAQYSNVEAFDENLVKYSSSLSTSRTGLGGAGNKDMVLIVGGNSSNVVDVFDVSLVRYSADPLTTSRGNLCGTVVNNYAFFAGGGSNNSPLANADAYELS